MCGATFIIDDLVFCVLYPTPFSIKLVEEVDSAGSIFYFASLSEAAGRGVA